ncbi:hypothetical protein [Hyphococcus luteus]|uniref:Antitoxin n=1 Tax=Hyphococcus luteus TaxID=2058213 RepID=A0A2S7K951_9PROT|nr:hypothetical protein [Marinicaulis flavus]PQA89011.1 hypothetical protein CW354_03415 [Marinicaulis flavus]
MTDKKPTWKPDDDEDLKDLIRATIKSAGSADPAQLPSKLREQIKGRVKGDVDIDAYVKKVLAEERKK